MSVKMKSLLLSALLALGVVGCNTIEGAGQDIERGGEVIQDKARR